jgi:GNAT superfamily N-acetyltransferase
MDVLIRPIDDPYELESTFQVLRQLRTELDWETFVGIYRVAQAADGYVFIGAFSEGRCLGVMGYRMLHDYVHGKHLYIDDLVVSDESRSRGIGARLLKYAEEAATRLQCKGLRLCTGVDNEAGKRFYEREGWTPRALAFKKVLRNIKTP